MHQPDDRLQTQYGQLPMEDRNPYILNYNQVQWYPNCRTSHQPAAPVNARYPMTYSTQPPEMAYLHPAAAQPFNQGNANCTPEFNDCGTHVPLGSKKKKRIVYGQHASSTEQGFQYYNGNILSFTVRRELIDYLRKKIKYVNEMEPDYADSDDNETHHAHPLWARNSTFTEPDSTHHVRLPVSVRQDPPQIRRRRQWTSTPSKYPQQHRNVLNHLPSKYPPHWDWIYLSLDLRMTIKRGSRNFKDARLPAEQRKRTINWKGTWKKPKQEQNQIHQRNCAWNLWSRFVNVRRLCLLQNQIWRTQDFSATANKVCDLPGPMSRGDDEDFSPLTQDLDLAKHIPCSIRDLTTEGQEENSLTHQGSLFGDPTQKDPLGSANITDSNRKVTPIHLRIAPN